MDKASSSGIAATGRDGSAGSASLCPPAGAGPAGHGENPGSASGAPENSRPPCIEIKNLSIAYGSFVLMRDISVTIRQQDIFIIMGGSGCGKSTLLRVLMGLKSPAGGTVHYGDLNFWEAPPEQRQATMRRAGVLFQAGALWSSMTLAENVGLPLQQYTKLKPPQIRELAALKLAMAGLAGFEDYYPSEISGGMRKRAGLARALALDPEIVFLDEPSAGLDPISARLLDDLILELRDTLKATFVIVTHELASIFAISNNSVFLDAESRTALAHGDPNVLLHSGETSPVVRRFLLRGAEPEEAESEKAPAGTKEEATEQKNARGTP